MFTVFRELRWAISLEYLQELSNFSLVSIYFWLRPRKCTQLEWVHPYTEILTRLYVDGSNPFGYYFHF